MEHHAAPSLDRRRDTQTDFLPCACMPIPRFHHEKWDGSGYPDGLAGEAIPLAARLFTFADVYDALTSNRPYRPAWSHAEALEYISKNSGLHFDPHIVPEFIQMMTE